MEKDLKHEILQQLAGVLNALEEVEVKGRNNFANLYGSMTVLDDVKRLIVNAEISEPKPSEKKK